MEYSIPACLAICSTIITAHGQDIFRPSEDGTGLWLTAHLNATVAESSGELEELSAHEHDPNDEFTLQGLEVGLNLKLDNGLSGFVNGLFFLDEEDNVESELEEAFLGYDIGNGYSVRGGRLLNRFGIQNDKHLHSWDYVDANLSTSQFLGEEGLISESIEFTWLREGLQWTTALTASYGQTVAHAEEEGEEEHGAGADEAFLGDDLFTSRAMFIYQNNDYHKHTLGLNAAFAENGFDRDSQVFSVDYAYTWSEQGLEAGGRYLTVGAEYFYRDIEWVHEDDSDFKGSSDQSSYLAYLQYGFAENWTLGLRYEYLQGVEAGELVVAGEPELALALEERQRASVALTRYHTFSDDLSGFARLQYNHDDLGDEGTEDSIFFQIGLNLGAGEAR